MKVEIREARMEDDEILLVYAARLFGEELPGLYRRPAPTLEEERAFLRSYCEPDNSVLLVAQAEGRIVGVAGLMGHTLPQKAHVCALSISVDQDFRGRGVGTQLVRDLLEWAPEHGIRRIEVEALANNPDAVRLYERLGFKREGTRKEAVLVDAEYVDAVFLALTPLS